MLDRRRDTASSLPSIVLQQAFQSWDGLLEWLPIGIHTCDRDGVLVQYNRKAAELWGRSPTPGESHCGACKAYRLDGKPLPLAETATSEVLHTGKPVRDRETIIERPDGSQIFILANVDPLFDEAGQIIGAVNCFQDITERKRAEGLLRDRERWFRELLEALPAAIYTTDAAGRLTFYNQAAVDLSGYRPELGTDQWCVSWRLFWPDGTPLPHDQCPMAVALKEGRPVRGAEAVAERPDGTRVPFIPFPTPLRDASGAVIGAVNMLVDITERKRAEERQNALLDELNHRVKNTLATVQSLAANTMRGAGLAQDVRESFEARLLALSKAHDQLTREHWESVDLNQILTDIVEPYANGDAPAAQLRGEPTRLPPKTALTLAMVFHELATNAAKYGALSVPEGALAVSWSLGNGGGPRTLSIGWEESNGPPVEQPNRRGFGSRLLERAIAHELNGTAHVAFDPAGVRCHIDIPL